MDANRFKELFLPYYRQLYVTAFKLTGNTEDAEDMVQETYIKLWKLRSKLNTIHNPEAFCKTIVRNLCLDKLRAQHYDTTTLEKTHATDEETPSVIIERKEANLLLYSLIEALPPIQKNIMLLHDVNGFSYEEIEKITGLNKISLRVTLSRARKKIREQFVQITAHENK